MANNNIIMRIKKRKAQALFDANRLNEAKALFQYICIHDPIDSESWVMLGLIMWQSGQKDEAASCFMKAITLRPDFAEAHYNLGKAYKGLGRLAEAASCFIKTVTLRPDFAGAHYNLGKTNKALGRWDEAAASFNAALRVRPVWPEALFELGNIYSLQFRTLDAATCFRRVLALKPEFTHVYIPFINLLITLGKADEAVVYAQRLVQANPDNVELKVVMAKIMLVQGQADRYRAVVKELVATGTKNIEVDFLYASLVNPEDAIALLEPWLTKNDQEVDHWQRTTLHFTLGDLYDKQKKYQQAFEHYHTANRLKPRAFNIDDFSAFVDDIISVFTPEFMATRPRVFHRSARPIFILGMPRSGTTLVEQILASHPDVYGAGELEDIRLLGRELLKIDKHGNIVPDCLADVTVEQCHQLADRYLARLDELAAGAAHVTDKMPQNFLRVGVIAMLFPQAKIIHCRRDPLDTCFSCYANDFATGHAYAYDLETLGKYYNEYRRLMHHWQTVLRIPMLDVCYESLVADQETMTRSLLDYCNLDWDDRCLQFYTNTRAVATLSYHQVRKPIYSSSVGRWQRYQLYLAPLLESLDAVSDYADILGQVSRFF